MGNCLPLSSQTKVMPIDTIFNLPSTLPSWPPGEGFASGIIDLGGLEVCQVTSFEKVASIEKGGPGNIGATFFEPSPMPEGFFMLGCYVQSNNKPLFGWVLVGKDVAGGTLERPVDFTLVWSGESSRKKKNDKDIAYIWLPTPPDGYKSVGHVVTSSPEKPSLEKVRCVRADLTEECEADKWIWGQGTTSDAGGASVYGVRPKNRGINAQGVSVGTFVFHNNGGESSNTTTISLSCLKNDSFSTLSPMPTLSQVEAIIEAYSPLVYFHPRETYLPSSVKWYFSNGVLLYEKEKESDPVPVDPTGSNLPQGGSNDEQYWLDLPVNDNAKEEVKKGNLQSFEAYVHIKPMLGATFTDIAIWIFYPFNGPSTAKLGLLDIPLGRIGEHVGDWEHITFRVSNFNGVMYNVYFAEHSGGTWVDSSSLEFENQNGATNKFVAYASLHGHASYAQPGLVLQGTDVIGIRNDTAKSKMFVDTGAKYSIVEALYIKEIVPPPWLNYTRKWGPKITYELRNEIEKIENRVPENLKPAVRKLADLIPNEVYGEDGPTGPKMKVEWDGDERVKK